MGTITPRALLTTLITSLSSTRHYASTSNPLNTPDPNIQPAVLTLHALFPNELLPALDLLDRGLVTRLTLANTTPRETSGPAIPAQEGCVVAKSVLYTVRSAQIPSNRQRAVAQQHTPSCEVRLKAWSCSCPAFAFAAFPAAAQSDSDSRTAQTQHFGSDRWQFGGLTLGGDTPVCKHLLACIVVEYCGAGFAGCAVEREVSVEELAGWAAGWGD